MISLVGRIIAGMPIRSAPAAVLVCAALLVNAGGAFARGASTKSQNVHEQMSLESAVQQVQRQTNGRILAADSIPNGRDKLYRIKVLTPDGHVRVMQLHSGEGPSAHGKKKDSGGS